jgi:hypothetical protein
MRSRRIRGGGAFVALLALVFAVVPAVLKGGDATTEFGAAERAVLVSLDTPAPGAQPAAAPTAGSHWALVDVPDPGWVRRGALGPGLLQAIVDYVHLLLAQPSREPELQLPVEGVAGGPGLSIRFTGSASPSQTVALGPRGATGVVTISILTVTTTEPAPPPTTEPTTEPTAPSTTPTTTAPPEPSTTTTTTVPSTTTVAPDPSTTTTEPTEPPTTTTSTTTTRPPAPSTTSTTTTTTPPASDEGPVTLPTTLNVAPQPFAGPRDARVWPFASDAPWNVPRGDGATFDSRPVVPGPFNINATAYGVCVGGAGYALNTNCGGEGHYSIYRADGVTVDEYYGYNPSTGGFVNHMVTDTSDDGVGVGYDVATQMSQLGGLIRTFDLQQGVIRHALQFIAAPTVLDDKVVWPAVSADAYITGNPNTGFVPYGSLLAIPSNAVMPTGLSPAGQMIWTALRNYGAYVNDSQGVPGSFTQNFSSIRVESNAAGLVAAAQADMARIGTQLRWVTNSGRDQAGGPGDRLAPLAPDLAGA